MLKVLVNSDGSVSCCTGLLGTFPQKDQEIVGKPAAMMQGKGVQAGESKDQIVSVWG